MRYDPTTPVDPEEWLALDDDERAQAVQRWVAERSGAPPEDCIVHAVPLMMVENQIVNDDPPIARATLERLTAAGIPRAVAVAMMAEPVFDQLQAIIEEERSFDFDAYAAALERLDPEQIKTFAEAGVDASADRDPEVPSSAPELSAEDRRVLLEFGERHADEGALGYPGTAGFLFAVMACPDLIMPSEWTGIVQGEAVFADVAEAESVTRARMALMNWISECIRLERPAIPEECRPDPDPMCILEADNDFSRWCRGFTAGHRWLEQVWNEEIVEDSEDDFALGSALVVLSFFNDRETAEAVVEESGPETGSVEESAKLFHPLIEDAIRDYAALGLEYRRTPSSTSRREPVRSKKVGRNEPCPCGSGRKYKKCCGGPGTVH